MTRDKVFFDQSLRSISTTLPFYITENEFIELSNTQLAIIEENQCSNLLIEYPNPDVLEANRTYIEVIWLPKAIKLGLKKLALISNSNSKVMFGQRKFKESIEIKCFRFQEAAKKWLNTSQKEAA